jgi:microsomal dipeptidase-like Zn-dependent dipeptidase
MFVRGRHATIVVLVATSVLVGLSSASEARVSSKFQLANGCFAAVSSANGRFVQIRGPDAYGATGGRKAAADPFFLKPTGLATYMLQDEDARLLAVESTHQVSRANDPGAPAEWRIRRSARHRRSFSITSTANGRELAIDPASGDLHLVPARSPGGPSRRFAFARDRGCARFPEAKVGARGKPFKGTRANGDVVGFADDHLHVVADLRAGGSVISGEGFDPFGVTEALGRDADVHGPDGSLDVTGNLLRTGSPVGTHDTHGWPTFTGWPVYDTYTHQQTYYMWLKRAWKAGERLVVAQMVEDEPLCEIEETRTHSCDEMETVKLQIQRLREMETYIDAQSGGRGRGWLRIVKNPWQARRVIERGKLAVVIGMETNSPLGCSEFQGQPQCTRDDIDRELRELRRLGLRGMFVAHWTDNAFAGAALQSGATGDFIALMEAQQTGHPFDTEPCGRADEADGDCNAKGLTGLGRYLIRRLMAKHMLIEPDHLSQEARKPVLAMAERRRYPLVSSHTGTGGEWTPSQLRRLYALGGLASARIDQSPDLAARVNQLRGYRSDKYYLGIGLGSDTGGFNAQPAPRDDAASDPLQYPFKALYCNVTLRRQKTGQRTYDLNKDGVAHYGLVPDLLADTRQQKRGGTAIRTVFRSAEAYLQMWERAYR